MENIAVIRNFMVNQGLNYLLVNATNEFLVEYNTLEENSRYKLTKFSGSTGEALVTPDKIYLFVDGRYHIQADQEVNHEIITVVKLQQGQKYLDELIARIPEHETLGIFSKKNSQKKYENLKEKRQIKLLDFDPLENNQNPKITENIALPQDLTGKSSEDKITKVSQNLSPNEALYITDLDEVSYLFNMRNFSQIYSAKIKAKAIIFKDNAVLFTQNKLKDLEQFLTTLDKEVYVDKNTINAFDYKILKLQFQYFLHQFYAIFNAARTTAKYFAGFHTLQFFAEHGTVFFTKFCYQLSGKLVSFCFGSGSVKIAIAVTEAG